MNLTPDTERNLAKAVAMAQSIPELQNWDYDSVLDAMDEEAGEHWVHEGLKNLCDQYGILAIEGGEFGSGSQICATLVAAITGLLDAAVSYCDELVPGFDDHIPGPVVDFFRDLKGQVGHCGVGGITDGDAAEDIVAAARGQVEVLVQGVMMFASFFGGSDEGSDE